MKEARIEVKGRVQGIHFRNNVKEFADKYGLKGSVLNLSDGGVLLVVQGEKWKVNEMVDWVRNSPGFSKVEDVDVSWSDIDKPSEDFKIVREGNFLLINLRVLLDY